MFGNGYLQWQKVAICIKIVARAQRGSQSYLILSCNNVDIFGKIYFQSMCNGKGITSQKIQTIILSTSFVCLYILHNILSMHEQCIYASE